MSYRVAVVGATGNVGRELLNILHERNFPVEKVHAVASSRSVGREVAFGDDQTLVCENLETFDFSECDFALFSAGAAFLNNIARRRRPGLHRHRQQQYVPCVEPRHPAGGARGQRRRPNRMGDQPGPGKYHREPELLDSSIDAAAQGVTRHRAHHPCGCVNLPGDVWRRQGSNG